MKKWLVRLQSTPRGVIIFIACAALCVAGALLFLQHYFWAYGQPYMMAEVIELSEGWRYSVPGGDETPLDNLRSGPMLSGGQTLTLYLELEAHMPGAALMLRTNHQTTNVYLDEQPLYLDRPSAPGENPGMALHFIPLPEGYGGKTLKIQLTSPYTIYSGRTYPVFMGTMASLEAYTLSQSMRSLIFMSMCLLIGALTIALSVVQAVRIHSAVRPEHLVIGIFSVVWALYFVSTEYISFQFFSPVQMSGLSLGIYYFFPVPLTLYFFFAFEHYRRLMGPAVAVHGAFAVGAIALQQLGLVDLPQLLDLNNILLAGLGYTAVLSVLEARKKNRAMAVASVFLIIAYGSMLHNFYVFYTRQGVVPYSYRDTFFLMLLCVLADNLRQFFTQYHQDLRQIDGLAMQNRLAMESYQQAKSHLQQISGIKHEVRNHFAALHTYMAAGRYADAQNYLSGYIERSGLAGEAVYHDHFLINALVGRLMHDAAQNGIEVELDLRASPAGIDEQDLYSLLSNILENAMEACVMLPPGRRRFIRLSLRYRAPYLTFCCVNSHPGVIKHTAAGLKTIKQEDGHGFGLWTMGEIAERYGGFVDTQYDDERFTLTAVLKDGPNT